MDTYIRGITAFFLGTLDFPKELLIDLLESGELGEEEIEQVITLVKASPASQR